MASVGTALLFEFGWGLIGYYLANFIAASIHGAAGGIIVLLLWVYYSAKISCWRRRSPRSGSIAMAGAAGELSYPRTVRAGRRVQ